MRETRQDPYFAKRCVTRLLLASVLLCIDPGAGARAADSSELWPDVEAFVNLGKRMRLYGNAAWAEGKESEAASLDLTAGLDVSIKPVRRKDLLEKDWQRSRYFWARVGYTRVDKVSEGIRTSSEDRLFVQLLAKGELPGQVWLEGRARAETRWIGENVSSRYRLRLEAIREYKARGHDLVPTFKAEWFYDTRYDGWSRSLFQLGSELTLTRRFRVEPYLAYQADRLPDDESLAAVGITAKFYF